MDFELHSERQAYVEVLELEVKKIVRMVRAFPMPGFDEQHHDCGLSARALAEGFVERLRRIEEIGVGHAAPRGAALPRSRGSLLMELETAFLEASEALLTLSASRWGEVIATPAGLANWRQDRRGEVLWLALRELVGHDRHFGFHLRAARIADSRGAGRESDGAADTMQALGA